MSKLQISFIIQIVINLLIIGMIILNDIDIRKLRADQMDNLNIMSATLDMYKRLKESQQSTNQALVDVCREEYQTLIGQYKIIIDEYNLIQTQHQKLLECWDGVEKRYSDSYEQFNQIRKQFCELKPILQQIVDEGIVFKTYVENNSFSIAQHSPIIGPAIPDPEYEPDEVALKPKKKASKNKKKEVPSGEDEKVSAAERFA